MRVLLAGMNATPATIDAQSIAARLEALLAKYSDKVKAPKAEPVTVAEWRDEAEDLACELAQKKRRAGRPSVKPAPVPADVRPEMTAAYVAELRSQLGITAEMLGDAAVSAKARASQHALHSKVGAVPAGGPSAPPSGTEAGFESPPPSPAPIVEAAGQDSVPAAESESPIAAVHGEGTSTPAAGTPDPADMEGAAPPPSSAAPSGDFPAILRSAIAARPDAASTPKLGQVVGRCDEDYLERLVAMNRRGQFPTVRFGNGRGWGARAGP